MSSKRRKAPIANTRSSNYNSNLINNFRAPKTVYCKTPEEFNEQIGRDFIDFVNRVTKVENECVVGLSHGQSPSGAYEYILKHYHEIKRPEKLHYTCINSKLRRQRGLVEVMDALSFLRTLLSTGKITKDQIIGRKLDRDNLEEYKNGLNIILEDYLKRSGKEGLDYVFVATDPNGQVAGITKNSMAFKSKKQIVEIVTDTKEPELTYAPWFLKKTSRIAFLATKSDKRRPLAWLYYRWASRTESPSFLRYMDDVEKRMIVFIDETALTWPQVVITRDTSYGESDIRLDVSIPFDKDAEEKLPVVIFIHGFLGLNTFDALLAFLPSEKYVAAALHYGTVPYDLPKEEYSQFVARNIDHAIGFFGGLGHPVYIFDHSMANTYLRMMDYDIENYPNLKKFLSGRISANPFFGQEAKHAGKNFLDAVILKAKLSAADRVMFTSTSKMIPALSKKAFRNTGIRLANWLIRTDSAINNRIWRAVKERILELVTDMDSLPALNKIPIRHTLNRLPIKIFAIQVYSALTESKRLDMYRGDSGFETNQIPILILKSEIDPIARFVPSIHEHRNNVIIKDITNYKETDIFREHLYYMIHPRDTIKFIDEFIDEVESSSKQVLDKAVLKPN